MRPNSYVSVERIHNFGRIESLHPTITLAFRPVLFLCDFCCYTLPRSLALNIGYTFLVTALPERLLKPNTAAAVTRQPASARDHRVLLYSIKTISWHS